MLLTETKSAKMDVYDSIFEDGGDALPEEFKNMSAEDVLRRTRLLDNEIRVLKDDSTRLSLEHSGLKEKVCIPKLLHIHISPHDTASNPVLPPPSCSKYCIYNLGRLASSVKLHRRCDPGELDNLCLYTQL